MLSPALRHEVEAALGESIARVTPVTGGCISPVARVQTAAARVYFLKWSGASDGRILSAEAHALERIGRTRTVRVPGVLTRGDDWLLLEWLEPAPATPAGWAALGARLAALHRVQNDRYGGPANNYIGSLDQQNDWHEDWADFWRLRRLEPQLELAVNAHLLNRADVQHFHALFNRLDTILSAGQGEGASLLHGDLWSGNVLATTDGMAVIDPSSYFGHREVDLAMAALFGGFPSAFHDAYRNAWPVERAGFEERQAVYQLYYLLVHVNLFGSSYAAGVRSALRTTLGS